MSTTVVLQALLCILLSVGPAIVTAKDEAMYTRSRALLAKKPPPPPSPALVFTGIETLICPEGYNWSTTCSFKTEAIAAASAGCSKCIGGTGCCTDQSVTSMYGTCAQSFHCPANGKSVCREKDCPTSGVTCNFMNSQCNTKDSKCFGSLSCDGGVCPNITSGKFTGFQLTEGMFCHVHGAKKILKICDQCITSKAGSKAMVYGDPHFTAFDGVELGPYDLAAGFYNLITHPRYEMNAEVKLFTKQDANGGMHVSAVGIMYDSNTILVTASAKKNVKVLVNDKVITKSMSSDALSLTISRVTDSATVIISTPEMDISIANFGWTLTVTVPKVSLKLGKMSGLMGSTYEAFIAKTPSVPLPKTAFEFFKVSDIFSQLTQGDYYIVDAPDSA